MRGRGWLERRFGSASAVGGPAAELAPVNHNPEIGENDPLLTSHCLSTP